MMWVKEKPNKECWFIAYNRGCEDEPYSLFQIMNVVSADGDYLALCLPDGDEWDVLEDFKADWYLILDEPRCVKAWKT